MTNEKIFELASISDIFPETLLDKYDCEYDAYVLSPEEFIKFAQTVHKQTLKDMISVLQNVPNPEANRTAINKILNHIEMEAL